MGIAAGELSARVAIQQATESRGDHGTVLLTWATVATRWMKIVPTGGGEATEADQVQATATHVATLRYYAGLTTRHRFVWGGTILNVVGIQVGEEMIVQLSEDLHLASYWLTEGGDYYLTEGGDYYLTEA